MADEAVIKIENLVKDYGETRAVDHLNLEIKKGEVFGLLGPNGAGKTTIILSLMGLSEPDAGKVWVKGIDATREPLKVKTLTSYLPDDVGFYNNYTGFENIVYTAMLNQIPRQKAEQSARELLDVVGLKRAADRKTGGYSKGMIQRLGLADVLIKEPEIMVLDEPTIGIDPGGIHGFLDMIRNLSKEKGITVLLSSHLLHQVQKICDRVGILVEGKLRALGHIKELASTLYQHRQPHITAEVDPEFITGQLIDELKQIDGIHEVSGNGHKIFLQGAKNSAPLVSRKIIQNGGNLYSLNIEEYGLDDIYQHYFKGGITDV